jgi:hypothetical protein
MSALPSGPLAVRYQQLAERARATGWQLHGEPAAVILRPIHAAALGLHPDPPPDHGGAYLVVVLSAAATDQLDALLAR